MNNTIKKIILALIVIIVIGLGIVWYLFTQKFDDTATQKSEYTISAIDLIAAFKKSEADANKKYAEKIITVTGTISEIEVADTTANIKMIDTTNGSYTIFEFQKQHVSETKSLKEGSNVSIKGSCSGGIYSDILDVETISLKRCVIAK